MTITHPTPVRNAHVDLIMGDLNGGTIRVYDAASVLLATFALPNPLAPAAVNGVGTANTIAPVSASATGTATRFEALTSSATIKFQGDVGLSGSGASLIVGTTAFVLNQTASINSLTYQAFP